MRKRTQSREFALQVLYKIDITHDPADVALDNFWQDRKLEDQEVEQELKDFTVELVLGVDSNLAALDPKIAQYATNWQMERMAVIDRNILRMGSFELIHREDIPPKVTINEAVELAKKYSGSESGKFVNAILDKIKQELGK